MTINTSTRTAGPFSGNGITTDFPFAFKVYARGDVVVARTVTATGVETVLTLDADYTVVINTDPAAPGGTIHMNVAPPTGTTLAATSNLPITQALDLTNGGGFYPQTINGALDRIVIQIQQVAAKVGTGLNVGGAAAINAMNAMAANLPTSIGASMVGFPSSAGRTVEQQLDMLYYGTANALDPQFSGGADNAGATDARPAIQAAIAARRAAGGGVVTLPPGRYLINGVASPDGWLNGLVNPYNTAHGTANRVWIEGAGADTVLVAGSNNMILLRHADSHSGVEKISFDGNGKTGVIGLGVMPEDTTQITTNVYTIYNVFRGLYMTGLAEGMYLTYGPKVAGSDSGCYYNRFDNIHIYSCLRGINAPTRPVAFGGGVGRNLFSNIRIGQNCNTGLEMRAGGTNTFLHCNFEGISAAGPNPTPTAVILTGVGNDSNYFVGCNIESCTRHIELDTTYTYWMGGSFDTTKCLFTQPLRTMVVDNVFTKGYIGGGGAMAPTAPLQIVTPNGADVRLLNAAGANTYWSMAGGAGNTVTYDAANATAQQIWMLNGAEKMRLNSVGFLKASNTGAYFNSGGSYHELYSDGNVGPVVVRTTHATPSGSSGLVDAGFTATVTQGNLFYGSNGGTNTYRVAYNGLVFIQGSQVLGARDTGWGANTGAASKAAFDPSTVTLAQLAQAVAALQTALKAHGLIGP